MIETIRKKIELNKEFHKWFSVYLANKDSVPLQERWECYVLACREGIFVREASYHINLKTLVSNGFSNYYDDFGYEKYKTVSLYELVDRVINDDLFPAVNIDELKEEILSTGYSSFVYDW